jgi:hypothetical protein
MHPAADRGAVHAVQHAPGNVTWPIRTGWFVAVNATVVTRSRDQTDGGSAMSGHGASSAMTGPGRHDTGTASGPVVCQYLMRP